MSGPRFDPRGPARAAGSLFALAVLCAALAAPTLAEARRNLYFAGNTDDRIAAYDVQTDGALSAIAGSPFPGADASDAPAITPTGLQMFTANQGTEDVSVFNLDASGAPVSAGPAVPSGANDPLTSAMTPDGRFLYIGNNAGSVSAFTIGAGGALTAVTGSPFAAASFVRNPAITPDARFLYAPVQAAPPNLYGYAVGADGGLVPLAGSPFSAGTNPEGASVTPDGRFLYVMNFGSNDISAFEIGGDGALTPLAGSPFPTGSAGNPVLSAVTPDGRFLYVTTFGGASVAGFEIGGGGALTPLAGSPFPTGGVPVGVVAAPSGRDLYVSENVADTIVAFDIASSGALSQLPGSPFASGVNSAGFQPLGITPDQGPTASISADVVDPPKRRVDFDGAASTDPDGTVTGFGWDFGDGETLADSDATPSHTYERNGTYTAVLRVTDNEGCSATRTFTGQTVSCNPSGNAVAQTTIDLEPPSLQLSGKEKQVLARKVAVKAKADQDGEGTATGKLVVATPVEGSKRADPQAKKKRTFKLEPVTKPLAANTKAALKPKLKRKAFSAAKSALKSGGKVKAKLEVSAADEIGNETTKKRVVKLKL